MAYLLDTNIVSGYLRHSSPMLVARIAATASALVYISVVTVEEIMQGRLSAVRQRETVKNYEEMQAAYDLLLESYIELQQFQIQPFDAATLAIFEGYSAAVRRAGANDCKIAATATVNGWVVVTRNTRHFDQIGVAHEDWSVSA